MLVMGYIPLIVCLIGLVVYFIATNPKVNHIGDVMFWTGLLVSLFSVAKQVLKIGS